MIKKPEDFDVLDCVGHHYYAPEKKKWLWHCVTCDCGTNKNWVTKHRWGHKQESSAAAGFEDHKRTMRMQRQQELYRAWWWQTIMTTKDVEVFRQLWLTHCGMRIAQDRVVAIMATVQSDPDLRATYLGVGA